MAQCVQLDMRRPADIAAPVFWRSGRVQYRLIMPDDPGFLDVGFRIQRRDDIIGRIDEANGSVAPGIRIGIFIQVSDV